jgi:hypothetical protein
MRVVKAFSFVFAVGLAIIFSAQIYSKPPASNQPRVIPVAGDIKGVTIIVSFPSTCAAAGLRVITGPWSDVLES